MAVVRDYTGIEFPPVLYKYRDWSDINHKRIVTHGEVYFASPRTFSDKLDCRNPVRYDLLNYHELYDKFLTENPYWTDHKIRNHIREWYKKRIKNIQQEQKKYQEAFFERLGVLSLTADSHNSQMWRSYSNNSEGFCIGFNSNILFDYLGGGGDVQYYTELPIIYPAPKHSVEEQIFLQIFSKLSEFAFEKEYRTHIFIPEPLTEADRKKIVPPEAYKEIIFGKSMSDNLKEDLLLSIPENLGHVELIEMSE